MYTKEGVSNKSRQDWADSKITYAELCLFFHTYTEPNVAQPGSLAPNFHYTINPLLYFLNKIAAFSRMDGKKIYIESKCFN